MTDFNITSEQMEAAMADMNPEQRALVQEALTNRKALEDSIITADGELDYATLARHIRTSMGDLPLVMGGPDFLKLMILVAAMPETKDDLLTLHMNLSFILDCIRESISDEE
ncbi:hypothetical protein QE321_gp095 [Pseudomonas phage SPA01]|uniref:Uncharacterized protein n=1 Tax=Pseudomonas phage SPA01 TaxID=3003719 RepID=A0A9Y1W069_9CAUD|nr:hypothetical protein QE321_gp095 [Pseudomonas phage SPA01]WFG74164.1 hypothetical protein DOEKDBNA_00123 [Pseudomonas phage SPA01]